MAAWPTHTLLRLSYLAQHFFKKNIFDREKLWRKLAEVEPRTGPGNAVSKPAQDFQVFRGEARKWPAARWSLGFFKKHYGKTVCHLLTDYGLADFSRRDMYKEASLGSVISQIQKGKRVYLRFSPLIERQPELMAGLNTDYLKSFRRFDSLSDAYHLFIGSKGTYTRLHSEMEVSVFVQLEGRKRWRLIRASDYAMVYPQFSGRTHFVTEFDAWPGKNEFPLLSKAEVHEITLEPGDVLYLPPFWWHYAENPGASVGISYRFNSLSLALKSSPFLTMMRLLSYNPSVFYTFYHAMVTKRNPLFEARR